jgi:hypothetical protein
MIPKDFCAVPAHPSARLEARQRLRNAENRAMRSGWLQYTQEVRTWAVILRGLNFDIYFRGRNCEKFRKSPVGWIIGSIETAV